jgi:sugar/nucleoside kinase (ribokinase family)
VVVLGDLMVDVVARLRGPLIPASDSPASIAVRGGGSAANTACWLASSGVETVFVGKVGNDAAGRGAVDALRACGVRPAVGVDPERPTGTVIVLVDESGERTMVPDAGANSGLRAEDSGVQSIGGSGHLHLSGYTLLNPESRDAGLAAHALSVDLGMTSSVDVSSAGPIAEVGPEAFLDWIQGADLVFANLDEARVLTGHDDPVDTARALTEHCRQAVVKLGSGGALWLARGGEAVRVGACEIAEGDVVDTTGAGDAFAAGFLPVWLGGGEAAAALEAGCRLAARAITQVGGRPLRS